MQASPAYQIYFFDLFLDDRTALAAAGVADTISFQAYLADGKCSPMVAERAAAQFFTDSLRIGSNFFSPEAMSFLLPAGTEKVECRLEMLDLKPAKAASRLLINFAGNVPYLKTPPVPTTLRGDFTIGGRALPLANSHAVSYRIMLNKLPAHALILNSAGGAASDFTLLFSAVEKDGYFQYLARADFWDKVFVFTDFNSTINIQDRGESFLIKIDSVLCGMTIYADTEKLRLFRPLPDCIIRRSAKAEVTCRIERGSDKFESVASAALTAVGTAEPVRKLSERRAEAPAPV